MKKLIYLAVALLLAVTLAVPLGVSGDEVYEYISVGETYTKEVMGTNSVICLVKVPETGLYTLYNQPVNTEAWITNLPAYTTDDPYATPPSLEAKMDTNASSYITYYLRANVTYSIEIMGTADGSANSATISLKSGCPSGRKHGVLTPGKPFTVSVSGGDSVCYAFTAPDSGKYMVSGSSQIHSNLCDANGMLLVGETYGGLYGRTFGTVHELTGGQNYVLSFNQSQGSDGTDTFIVEKCDTVNSGEIEIIAYYHKSGYRLYLKTDPLGAVVNGVQWSISDSSVFSMNVFGEFVELDMLKEGSAVITAKVDGKTFTRTVYTNPKTPKLELDKTERVLARDALESSGDFTPSSSGIYQFSVTPVMSDPPARFILSRPDGSFIYDNRIDRTVAITADLEAGKTYSLYPENCCFDVTITKIADAPTPQESTQAPAAPTQPPQNTDVENNDSVETPDDSENDVDSTSDSTTANDGSTVTAPSTEPIEGTTEATKPDDDTKPTDAARPTTPAEQDDKVNVQLEGDKAVITPGAVKDFVQNGGSGTIVVDVSNETNVGSVKMDGQALALAADNKCSMSFVFSDDVRLELDAECIANIANQAGIDGVSLTVRQSSSDELNDMQKKTLQNMNVAAILDISLDCADSIVHELGSKAYITIPCPDAEEGNWSVYYIDDAGNLEEMTVIEYGKDTVLVATDHFSVFALAKNASLVGDADQNTDGSGWIIALVVVVLLAGGTTAAYFILKKKDMLPTFLKK